MQEANQKMEVAASHDFERLFDHLIDVLKVPLKDPLAPEIIVVPSKGLARWLSLKIAASGDNRGLGICANIHFLLPTEFIWRTCRLLLPELPERSPFALDALSLRLLRPLWDLCEGKTRCGPCAKRHGCDCRPKLQNYLGDGGDESALALKTFGLASALAHLYENYLTHRSRGAQSKPLCSLDWNWTNAWESGQCLGLGEHEAWQQAIWQRVTQEDGRHLAWAIQEFCRMKPSEISPEKKARLPSRVSLFGHASLPPLYLDFIEGLRHHVSVHGFFFSPSREYWGDLKRWEDTQKRLGDEPFSPLALWGMHGQLFFQALIEKGWLGHAPEEFPLPEGDTLLRRLQRQILTLEEEKPSPTQADAGILIQSAPTPAREVEILFDALLAFFDADKTLTPDDVLVLVSDLRRYAPHIEAVFGSKKPAIPYSIADVALGDEKSLMDGFLHLLGADEHRFGIGWMLDFLHVPAFCRRFALDESDTALIRQMAQGANMRWGYDEHHRQALELWQTPEHTLRHGALRYLHGFVGLQAGAPDAFGVAVSPLDLGGFDAADTLGKWMWIQDLVKRFADDLKTHRTISDWAAFLAAEQERFFAGEEEESRPLSRLLRELRDIARSASLEEALPFAVIRSWLAAHAGNKSGPGLFRGGVTFAAMMAERVFPKKVIAMIGLGNDDFPRKENRLSFDLLAPRSQDGKRRFLAGDPGCDSEDRYFFLQNILLAKDCLYLSHAGKNPANGEAKPPAAVVLELLDWLKQQGISQECTPREHPILSYDPLYFQEGGFFTYDEGIARAMSRQKERRNAQAALWKRLENPGAALPEEISLEGLIAFFKNPSRGFLKAMDIHLPEPEEVSQDREPFGNPQGLEKSRLRQAILEDHFNGINPETSKAIIRSKGLLPHGFIGDSLFNDCWKELGALAASVQNEQAAKKDIEIQLGSCRLQGQLSVREKGGILSYHHKEPREGDEIAFWLRHLALCASGPQAQESLLIYVDERLKCKNLKVVSSDEARAGLQRLIDLCRQGLQKPLLFFPQGSKDFCQGKSWDTLEKGWQGRARLYGDGQNPWHRYLYRDSPPFDESEFQELAREIWQPILQALSQKSKGKNQEESRDESENDRT